LLATFHAVLRSIADESARTFYLVHDRIAGVDACGAMHAFHLRAVANVDAGRAHRDAGVAVHAIARAVRLAQFDGLPSLQRATLLAAFVVVGHDQSVFIHRGGHETAVRTNERAGLLAEPREDGVEEERKCSHESQTDE